MDEIVQQSFIHEQRLNEGITVDDVEGNIALINIQFNQIGAYLTHVSDEIYHQYSVVQDPNRYFLTPLLVRNTNYNPDVYFSKRELYTSDGRRFYPHNKYVIDYSITQKNPQFAAIKRKYQGLLKISMRIYRILCEIHEKLGNIYFEINSESVVEYIPHELNDDEISFEKYILFSINKGEEYIFFNTPCTQEGLDTMYNVLQKLLFTIHEIIVFNKRLLERQELHIGARLRHILDRPYGFH